MMEKKDMQMCVKMSFIGNLTCHCEELGMQLVWNKTVK